MVVLGFNMVNVGIDPESLAANPIIVLLLVQSNEEIPPEFVVTKLTPNESPSHTTCEIGGVTFGDGFTIKLMILFGPVQLFALAGKVNT